MLSLFGRLVVESRCADNRWNRNSDFITQRYNVCRREPNFINRMGKEIADSANPFDVLPAAVGYCPD